MKTLVLARPLILTMFFASLVAIGIGVFINTGVVFRTGGIMAQIALFLFLLTESFGSISNKRSRASRNIARVFLGLSGFVVAGIVAYLIMVLLHNGQ